MNDVLYHYCFSKSNHFKATGRWGDNVERIYDHGILKIFGSGAIKSISNPIDTALSRADRLFTSPAGYEVYPWSTFATNITEISVSDGITEVPDSCFSVVWNGVKKITFGKDVKTIDASALNYISEDGRTEKIDIYFPEQTVIKQNNKVCFFSGSNSNIVIHGYKNSPIYYYVIKYISDYEKNYGKCNVEFDSLGEANGNYSDYDKDFASDFNIDDDLDSILDLSNNILYISAKIIIKQMTLFIHTYYSISTKYRKSLTIGV